MCNIFRDQGLLLADWGFWSRLGCLGPRGPALCPTANFHDRWLAPSRTNSDQLTLCLGPPLCWISNCIVMRYSWTRAVGIHGVGSYSRRKNWWMFAEGEMESSLWFLRAIDEQEHAALSYSMLFMGNTQVLAFIFDYRTVQPCEYLFGRFSSHPSPKNERITFSLHHAIQRKPQKVPKNRLSLKMWFKGIFTDRWFSNYLLSRVICGEEMGPE